MTLLAAGPTRRRPAAPTDRTHIDDARAQPGDDLARLPRRLAQAFIVLAIVTSFDVLPLLPRYHYLAVVIGVGIVLLAGPRGVGRIRVVLPITLYAIWSVAALAWSVQPNFTFYELRATVALVMMIMVVASIVSTETLVRAFVVALEICCVASFYYLLVHPETRLYDSYNPALGTAWRAGFVHKNNLAMFSAMAVPCLLAFEPHKLRRRTFAVLFVVLVLGSRSATGLIGITLALGTWWWSGLIVRRRPRSRAMAIAYTVPVVAAAGASAILAVAGIANLLGKDITLTGRTHIWKAILPKIGQRLLLGWGPGAFYGGSYNQWDADVIRNAGFFHPHTHNALLELLLNEGLVGTVLALALVATIIVGGVRLLDRAPVVMRWTLAVVVPMIAMSASERTIPEAGWFGLLVIIRVVQLGCRRPKYATRDSHPVPAMLAR